MFVYQRKPTQKNAKFRRKNANLAQFLASKIGQFPALIKSAVEFALNFSADFVKHPSTLAT
ncbi:hypothetical protein BKG94_02035 [Rodentibacter ratti]|uniref:hypothetical protein n=1 Tax=Rodentibacter ratti TaxID=1906745 RepID=UPI0009844909|nr:hypothetical protein [Rodentibacter ratti]OOF89397.1 hypothetical protein BKG94_02035 [Rodentibacter ratti]